MSSSRGSDRPRHGLHPLSTASLGSYNAGSQQYHQLNTPISAVSAVSSNIHSAQTPSSSIQPYNPQQWIPSPAAMADSSQRASSRDPRPPPPPPYSPPRSQHRQSSHDYDSTPSATPPQRLSTSGVHRPSPEPQVNPSFPPPPGVRGNSRERRFGLSSLARRRDHDQASGSPGPSQSRLSSRLSMGPIPLHALNMEPMPGSSAMFQHAPPAARRAASTGAIDTPTSARSRSDSQTRWEPGMPVPPPPPGPPPAALTEPRSQSVQPLDRSTVPIISPPTRRRRPPSEGTSLGPVPPTPAGWKEGNEQQEQSHRGRSPGLSIDVTRAETVGREADPPLPSSSSLNRAGAVRHDKTILQRRSESRNRHESRGSIDGIIRPRRISDIIVPRNANDNDDRTGEFRSSPRSGGNANFGTPRTGDSSNLQDSRNSTPRAIGSAKLPPLDTATPPFSPETTSAMKQATGSRTNPVVPKALPTPPSHSQNQSATSSKPRDASRPPSRAATPVSKHLIATQSAEQFATASLERYQAFVTRESMAATDADRVRLFADFIVNESRFRRERYSSAIGAMGSEIFDLTRDLFRPIGATRRESGASVTLEWTPGSSEPTTRSHRGSFGSSHLKEEESHSNTTSSNAPTSPSGGGTANVNWSSNFMPSLSPILSMSVSDRIDADSRGRPSSRWWEDDSQGDPARGLERSKRESKYMGVPKNQWVETENDDEQGDMSNPYQSSTEYPPEKVGWHEPQQQPSGSMRQPQIWRAPARTTPSPGCDADDSMDISRLITMPPPYPRHHPAVNNSHPELAVIRSAVRTSSDLGQMVALKDKFALESSKRREDFGKATSDQRQALRMNLQREVASGNLGYADAAAIEASTEDEENSKKKELEKSEYERFQNDVIMPLNDSMIERIAQSTKLFDDLSMHLFDNGEIDPDMPQEEGDDKPELLEKLTLLKWIFEARESLHKSIYDVLSERNRRYCEVVVTPYKLSGNTEKLKSAEAFFAEDAAKREFDFRNEVLNRSREFRSVIEHAVEHGVALQLSAFWDIAPPLCGLLDSIPSDLAEFSVQIPLSELEENPVYRNHPLQYLFSLVLHAEKSTYQFIESHTNLLCLLHEVKEAVVHAKARVLAAQLHDSDGTPMREEEREERARHLRQSEGQRLTEDLKDKVRVVRDQWNSALGESIGSVKERAGAWLLETGGWDESLEEVGGVVGVQ